MTEEENISMLSTYLKEDAKEGIAEFYLHKLWIEKWEDLEDKRN